MMRAAWILLLAVAVVFALTANVQAADDVKELKGTLVCGKCKLKETTDCANVLQVKDGDKTVNYYLKDDGKSASYHKSCCTKDTANVTVKGTVAEKDGKKWIMDPKVTLP
jgi:hypothetical protein